MVGGRPDDDATSGSGSVGGADATTSGSGSVDGGVGTTSGSVDGAVGGTSGSGALDGVAATSGSGALDGVAATSGSGRLDGGAGATWGSARLGAEAAPAQVSTAHRAFASENPRSSCSRRVIRAILANEMPPMIGSTSSEATPSSAAATRREISR
jgi:hypothetical protein